MLPDAHAVGDGFQDGVHGGLGADQAVQIRLGDTEVFSGGRLVGGHDGQVSQSVFYPEAIPAALGDQFSPDVDHVGLEQGCGQVDNPGAADATGRPVFNGVDVNRQ